MEPINLEPRYSTPQLPGKCLAGQLLVEQGEDKKLQKRYALLLSFLKSSESKKLRDETEKYLAEGKDVKVKVYSQAGKMKYEIKINELNEEGGN